MKTKEKNIVFIGNYIINEFDTPGLQDQTQKKNRT